jgi:hypothetical protein
MNIIDYTLPFDEQARMFKNLQVDYSVPGFYDDPNFMEAEKKRPDLLDNYASFVKQQEYSIEYNKKADHIIQTVSGILHKQLEHDGRLGACVDVSNALSKILEKEGIWNYVVKGSLTITFTKVTGLQKKYFWSAGHGEFSAGHAWVVAPPYTVIDLSIKQQPYPGKEGDHIPQFIISKTTVPDIAAPEDILQTDILRNIQRAQSLTAMQVLKKTMPRFEQFTNFFKPLQITIGSTHFKYSPVAIAAPDTTLTEFRSLCLLGKHPNEIYTELIKPLLQNIIASND